MFETFQFIERAIEYAVVLTVAPTLAVLAMAFVFLCFAGVGWLAVALGSLPDRRR